MSISKGLQKQLQDLGMQDFLDTIAEDAIRTGKITARSETEFVCGACCHNIVEYLNDTQCLVRYIGSINHDYYAIFRVKETEGESEENQDTT